MTFGDGHCDDRRAYSRLKRLIGARVSSTSYFQAIYDICSLWAQRMNDNLNRVSKQWPLGMVGYPDDQQRSGHDRMEVELSKTAELLGSQVALRC